MLKNTFFLLFLLTTFALYAQFIDTNPFRQLDKYALNTPEEFTYSVETLSQYLSAEALSEKEKVRAIYIWIANNIAYDDTAFFQGQRGYLHENAQHFQKQQPEQVLKNRIAVCEGYANLFKALCEKADIQAEIVTGYCKGEDGKLADMFHAWNVVKVADEWQMIDVTWGAGGLDTQNNRYIRHYNDRYFLQDKKYFLLSHFPHDPL